MYPLETLDFGLNRILFLGLSMLRLSTCFILFPFFSSDVLPSIVRNTTFVSLSLILVFVHLNLPAPVFSVGEWISAFTVEILVGIAIGLFLGSFLWAFEAAGFIIDTQVGTGQAMILDPLAGHEVTLNAEFLSRLSAFIFLSLGGIFYVVKGIYGSYALLPLGTLLSDINPASVDLFQKELQSLFGLVLILAAPALVIFFMIDVMFATLSRYSPNLNAQFLSNSLKSLAAVVILLLTVGLLVDFIFVQFEERIVNLPAFINALQAPTSKTP